MEYLFLVVNSFLYILRFQSILLSSLFIILLILLYYFWKRIIHLDNNLKYVIVFCRFLLLMLLLPIITNLTITKSSVTSSKQNIGIIVDDSISMKEKLLNSDQFQNFINIINHWSSTNTHNVSWYNMNYPISLDTLTFSIPITDFTSIIDIVTNNELDQVIILSDGNSDMYEENLMRRLAGLLYIDDRTIGEIKLKIQEK